MRVRSPGELISAKRAYGFVHLHVWKSVECLAVTPPVTSSISSPSQANSLTHHFAATRTRHELEVGSSSDHLRSADGAIPLPASSPRREMRVKVGEWIRRAIALFILHRARTTSASQRRHSFQSIEHVHGSLHRIRPRGCTSPRPRPPNPSRARGGCQVRETSPPVNCSFPQTSCSTPGNCSVPCGNPSDSPRRCFRRVAGPSRV